MLVNLRQNIFLYKELPNSTAKFRRVMRGSMGANMERTWGRKRRLVGKNRDKSSFPSDDETYEKGVQMNARIWSSMVGLKQCF
ncbi:hypothetical protein TNCV_2329511 [Trichonephila clavipes]|nr:hypothetical protein TNCV_2329511 [Trichonephila clavipes]